MSPIIFDVAYHVIPRSTSHPLHSHRLAWVHLRAADAGLALLGSGWRALPTAHGTGMALMGTRTLATAVGAAIFIMGFGAI